MRKQKDKMSKIEQEYWRDDLWIFGYTLKEFKELKKKIKKKK